MAWEYIVIAIVFIAFISITGVTLSKTELTPLKIVLAGLFAALTSVGAYLTVPLPLVPFTMQSFFCLFAGILLGSKLGMVSQMIYVLVGLVGMPVFKGASGGPYYVFQSTFGYLIGFIVGAYVCGLIVEKWGTYKVYKFFVAGMAGLACIYAIGVPYLYIIQSLYLAKEFSFQTALKVGFLSTILGDTVSIVMLSYLALVIKEQLKRAGIADKIFSA